MPKPKGNFIDRAIAKRGLQLPPSINGEPVHKQLEERTLQIYQQKLNEWDHFVQKVRPGATVHDLEALKHFVYLLASGIEGTNNLQGCVETVRSYWNRFTAAWQREHEAVPAEIAKSVTNVSVKHLLL